MEIRRDLDGPLQQHFRLVRLVCLERNQREQPERIDVARILAKHPAIQALCLLEAAFLLVLRRERHEPPLGRALEAFFEGDIRFLAAAEQCERLAEVEPGALERRVEARRALEEWQRVRRTADCISR